MSSVWTPNFECNEEFTTRQENWNTDNPVATVTIRCNMDERYLVMTDIVGNYRIWPFNTPVPLYATNAVIRLDRACKMPDVQTQSRFETGYDALIDLTYTFVKGRFYTQTEDENWPESLFADEDMEPSMQFLTDDYSKYGWGKPKYGLPGEDEDAVVVPGTKQLDKTLKPGEESGKAFYELAVTRMVKGYKQLPTAYVPVFASTGSLQSYTPLSFEKWPGHVHFRTYYSELLDMEFKGGTLLFTQPRVIFGPGVLKYGAAPTFTPLGPTWSITAKLLYQEQGWNVFYRPTCEEDPQDPTKKVEVEDPYYVQVHKGCKNDNEAEYPIHRPYEYADMTEFIFNSTSFPPNPWPPEASGS